MESILLISLGSDQSSQVKSKRRALKARCQLPHSFIHSFIHSFNHSLRSQLLLVLNSPSYKEYLTSSVLNLEVKYSKVK